MTERPRPEKASYRVFIKHTMIKHGKFKKISHTINYGKYLDSYHIYEAMDRLAYQILTSPKSWNLTIVATGEKSHADEFKISAHIEISYTNTALSHYDKRRYVKKTIQVAPTLTLKYNHIIETENTQNKEKDVQ